MRNSIGHLWKKLIQPFLEERAYRELNILMLRLAHVRLILPNLPLILENGNASVDEVLAIFLDAIRLIDKSQLERTISSFAKLSLQRHILVRKDLERIRKYLEEIGSGTYGSTKITSADDAEVFVSYHARNLLVVLGQLEDSVQARIQERTLLRPAQA